MVIILSSPENPCDSALLAISDNCVCMVHARGRVSNLVRCQVISLESSARERDYLMEYQGSRSRGSSKAARGTRAAGLELEGVPTCSLSAECRRRCELEIISTRRLRTSQHVTYQSKQPTLACTKKKF
jgi:hypothetical protein